MTGNHLRPPRALAPAPLSAQASIGGEGRWRCEFGSKMDGVVARLPVGEYCANERLDDVLQAAVNAAYRLQAFP